MNLIRPGTVRFDHASFIGPSASGSGPFGDMMNMDGVGPSSPHYMQRESIRMRSGTRTGWMGALAAGGLMAGAFGAAAADTVPAAPTASPPRTILWSDSPTAVSDAATATRSGTTMMAQARISPGPLQGPLQGPPPGPTSPSAAVEPAARCSYPVRRVVHHRRMVRRVAPVPVAAVVPPPVPVVPVYAYPPPPVVVYRPVVPVYGVRPFYRPFLPYRPFPYRPFVYGGYGRIY